MFDFFHVVDDKCGSFWCELPVVENGRDSKALAGNKYSFSVQANVICGDGGVQRFAIVPKNVQTGSNFG
jgi:hypothetical protein